MEPARLKQKSNSLLVSLWERFRPRSSSSERGRFSLIMADFLSGGSLHLFQRRHALGANGHGREVVQQSYGKKTIEQSVPRPQLVIPAKAGIIYNNRPVAGSGYTRFARRACSLGPYG